MGLKKQLGMGVASAALGLAMVGGGTFAYFSDEAEADGTFAAGTLDLSAKPTTVIDVKDLKPGDHMNREFKLKNEGSLDISKVTLETEYSVVGNDDFGEDIKVNFLRNLDKDDGEFLSKGDEDVIATTTLDTLRNKTVSEVVENQANGLTEILGGGEDSGLKADYDDTFDVQFKFVDDGDQNEFQGAELNLEWTFNAEQTDGEEK